MSVDLAELSDDELRRVDEALSAFEDAQEAMVGREYDRALDAVRDVERALSEVVSDE